MKKRRFAAMMLTLALTMAASGCGNGSEDRTKGNGGDPGSTSVTTSSTTEKPTTATTEKPATTETTATTEKPTTATTEKPTTATTEKATETTEKKDPDALNKELYKPLLDDMHDAWKRGDKMDYWSGTLEYASENLSQKWKGYRYGDKYQFADINKDGTSELILYDGNDKVMAIYTLSEAKNPSLLLEFRRGDTYFHYDFLGVTGDGEIACNFDFLQQRGDYPGKVLFGIEKEKLTVRAGYAQGGEEYYPIGETTAVDIDTGFEQTQPTVDDSQELPSGDVANVDGKLGKATSITTGTIYSFDSYK